MVTWAAHMLQPTNVWNTQRTRISERWNVRNSGRDLRYSDDRPPQDDNALWKCHHDERERVTTYPRVGGLLFSGSCFPITTTTIYLTNEVPDTTRKCVASSQHTAWTSLQQIVRVLSHARRKLDIGDQIGRAAMSGNSLCSCTNVSLSLVLVRSIAYPNG